MGFGRSLLTTAVRKGDAALLNRLLAAGSDANSLSRRKSSNLTPLDAAIIHTKRADPDKALLRAIIQYGDPKSIVWKACSLKIEEGVPYSINIEKGVPLKTALLVA